MIEINNRTSKSFNNLQELIEDLFSFAQDRLDFNQPVSVYLISSKENYKNPLGKTAYYDPKQFSITIYTDGRHTKDMLRSFSHELVHHTQNCKGEFEDSKITDPQYAQNDEHLRDMEMDAYLRGNMILRDFEDKRKWNLMENFRYKSYKRIAEKTTNELSFNFNMDKL